MTVATFDPLLFKARYPEFSAVSDVLLSACFDDAGLYLNNTDSSTISVARRTSLLWMLTAHIAALGGALSADGKPSPVGRVASAGEGSVSASFEFVAQNSAAAWFAQTQYGAAFWQATSSTRGFRYLPNPTRY